MFRQFFVLALLSSAIAGCTSAAPRRHDTAIGAVQAVYVEVAPDIYVSERLLAAPPTQDYWVKVAISGTDTVGDTAMALVPAAMRLAAGDQVAVEVVAPLSRDPAMPTRRANRVRNLLRHGALAQSATPPHGDVIDRYLSDTTANAP